MTYGGTSATLTAAVEVLISGKSVVIVYTDVHLGGIYSGGLRFTKTGKKEIIGGLSRDSYHRVYKHYQDDAAWKWKDRKKYGNRWKGTPAIDGENCTIWIIEPHVAEQGLEDYIKEFNIPVFRDEWLYRERSW